MDTEILSDASIHPIRIPTPFAVGDVFSYVIIDDKIVLVDTGHFADSAFDVITKKLSKYNLVVRDLDEIWLTHGHPDHYGQAKKLADCSGAIIYGHRKERANFAGNDNADLFRNLFNVHKIPKKYTREMLDQLKWLQQFQQSIEPEWISDGDQLISGELKIDITLTPGHAPGHLAFVSDQGVIFGGDLLLDHISTNALINFDADTGQRNKSLLQYRDSLQWIRKQQGIVLPGHGKKIEEISQVTDHHLKEHEHRYRQIQGLLDRQPMSLMELSYEIFPDAVEKGGIFLVLSEVLGYLDWGIEEGTMDLDENNMVYEAVSNK